MKKDSKIRFFAPSYKRSERLSSTQQVYPFVKLVVSVAEKKSYIKTGNDVISCPKKVQGNVSRVRNWILDHNMDADLVVIMDDDMAGVTNWRNRKLMILSDDELLEFCEIGLTMALDMNIKMFGVNCLTDKGAYREYTPFNFNRFLGGPFGAFLKGNQCRYDEGLPLKEDYDMTLQQIRRYGRVLRFNAYSYIADQSNSPGGCATYRNLEVEKEQFFKLMYKWGSDVVRRDKSSKRSFDYNPIIKSPIIGV